MLAKLWLFITLGLSCKKNLVIISEKKIPYCLVWGCPDSSERDLNVKVFIIIIIIIIIIVVVIVIIIIINYYCCWRERGRRRGKREKRG